MYIELVSKRTVIDEYIHENIILSDSHTSECDNCFSESLVPHVKG